MTEGPRIVLVGHDASRTGAPILGLSWVRWLLGHTDARVSVDLQRGGPLLDDFAALAPTTTRGRPHQLLQAAVDGGLVPDRVREALLAVERSAPHRRDPGNRIVVANTVAAWAAATEIRPRRRLVCWVHELDGVADRLVTPAQRAQLLGRTDHLVAEGERVAEMLRERWHVPASRVSTVDSFIDAAPAPGPDGGPHQLIGVGSLVPRKGADTFVEVVAHLHERDPDLRAAWVGGDLATPYASLVRTDIDAADLGAAIDLPGAVSDVGPWWPAHGVLVHTAREDPAPLVVLEAAHRGVPVVTWAGSGAGDLLQAAGCGHLTAAPGDVFALARAARELLDDPHARRAAVDAVGAAAAHRTTEAQGPKLLEAVLGAHG